MVLPACVDRIESVAGPLQFTLAIEHPHQQRLENFVVGENAELLAALQPPLGIFSGLWMSASVGAGRSHLMRGRCLLAQQSGVKVHYVGCADYVKNAGLLVNSLQLASTFGAVVAVDDVALVAGDSVCEELLMATYQRLLEQGGQLLVSHEQAATYLEFDMPDLNSRMRSLLHYHIQPLDDTAKSDLLQQRAFARGYVLSEAVVKYWMSRGPRDLGALLTDLDVLDRASLVRQQAVTIPLLKQVLGY